MQVGSGAANVSRGVFLTLSVSVLPYRYQAHLVQQLPPVVIHVGLLPVGQLVRGEQPLADLRALDMLEDSKGGRGRAALAGAEPAGE